jgi:hypothetical protein
VRLVYNEWDRPENADTEKIYRAQWQHSGELAEKSGHGGGDFWVNYHFAQAIKENKQPFLDVYRGVAMSSVGILIHRSETSGGMPQIIPDFRDKTAREQYRNDTFRPDETKRYWTYQ